MIRLSTIRAACCLVAEYLWKTRPPQEKPDTRLPYSEQVPMRNATLPHATYSRSRAVDGLAWGFLVFSALTLALLILPLLPGEALLASLSVEAGSGGLTDGVIWLFERSSSVTLLLMIGASITLGLSIALLQRRPWARQAFIGLMGLGFVAVLGGAAITPLT